MTRKRILFADDDDLVRQYIARVAELLAHDVVIVDDAARAWELVLNGEQFDLIISDNDMPEMKGVDFLRNVRSNPATAATPFILHTGNDSPPLADEVATLKGIFAPKGGKISLRRLIAAHLPQT